MPIELLWTLAAIAGLGIAISVASIAMDRHLDRRRDRQRRAHIMNMAMGDPHKGTG